MIDIDDRNRPTLNNTANWFAKAIRCEPFNLIIDTRRELGSSVQGLVKAMDSFPF